MRLRYTEGGQKRAREEKFKRIIRIMWKRFSDDWSYGAAIKEKPTKIDSIKCDSKILPAKTAHQK